MSEQILERPAPAPSAQEPEKRSSRMFLVVGGSVIAGLILGGAFLMLRPVEDPVSGTGVPAAPVSAQGDQSDQSDSGATAAQDGVAAAADGEAPAEMTAEGEVAAEGAGDQPSGTKRVRLTSRDPFAPLVAKAAPAPEKKPDAAPAAEQASAPKPASGGTISALTVSPLGNSVKLKLDGKKYTVDEGEAFAKSYRLYDIFNANCAGFLYGDQNAVVCEGDSVKIG
jgi:hypothetical protein